MKHEVSRDEWVRASLRGLPSGTRVLDAGAGEQPYRDACAHLDYVSQDFGAYHGEGEAGLHLAGFDATGVDIVCDIDSIPEPDGSFGAVLCTEVLEHVPDAVSALRELARLLEPGGELIITAPFASLTHFAPYHHASGFNRYFYEHHLPELGCDIVELKPNGDFFSVLAVELSRASTLTRLGTAERLAQRLLVRDLMGRTGHSDLLCHGWFVRARKR